MIQKIAAISFLTSMLIVVQVYDWFCEGVFEGSIEVKTEVLADHVIVVERLKMNATLEEIENQISWWANIPGDRKQDIRIFGSDAIYAGFGFVHLARDMVRKRGFRPVSNKGDRDGPWLSYICAGSTGSCLSGSRAPTKMKPYQRLNKIPHIIPVLTNKAGFCATVSHNAMEQDYLESTFDCWIYPKEKSMNIEYAAKNPNVTYIVKPTNSGKGKGIEIVNHDELRKIKGKKIVQTLLTNPLLLNGFKFDLRTYAAHLEMMPTRIAVHQRGLVRIAGAPYNGGHSKGQLLTNTHVSNLFSDLPVSERTWSFARLEEYLGHEKYKIFFKRVLKSTASVMLCAEREFKKYYFKTKQQKATSNFYQLVGIDFIADENLNVKMIEINTTPSLSLSSEKSHYSETKLVVIQDILRLVIPGKGTVVPEITDILNKMGDKSFLKDITSYEWAYIIRFVQEYKNRGGYHFAYPNPDLDLFHEHYLNITNAAPKRKALHKLVNFIAKRLVNEQQR